MKIQNTSNLMEYTLLLSHDTVIGRLLLESGTMRNYDAEIKDVPEHKYSYRFDVEVMHHYILKELLRYARRGPLLELGSFKGDFTERLCRYFQDITCVDASSEAISDAKKRLGTRATFLQGQFEKIDLPFKYDTVVMVHVLEHLDDPIQILGRINNEWLNDAGRLFLVCPNANAPSRQIAVKMGLISHNAAVTPAEAAHGHRKTYALDTLESAAKAAGLTVVHRGGIFFKALANFQWDRLLETDIISQEYLEGCYQLGQLYPDLCSSIVLVCERA